LRGIVEDKSRQLDKRLKVGKTVYKKVDNLGKDDPSERRNTSI
jgi:hypothetical protein